MRPHRPSSRDLATLEPRRILILKPSSLGDVVHALPVLAALRSRWPDAAISWLLNRGLVGLLDGHPWIAEVIPFDRKAIGPGPRGLLAIYRLAGRLRSARFDLVIDLQGLLRSGLLAWSTRSPVRIGLADAREGATRFYTHRIAADPGRPHAVDRLLVIPEALGIATGPARFVLPPFASERAWARDRLAMLPRPRIVFNMGARWPTKRWPPESFAEVARLAVHERGAGLVVVGASEDRPTVERFLGRLGPLATDVVDLAGATSLPQLAAVAAESDLFLSNDSGPLHLAAAAGAEVVGIYTCTRPERTGPYGPRASWVATGVPCAGSCVKRCDRMICMPELTAARVWSAVRARLDRPGTSHAA